MNEHVIGWILVLACALTVAGVVYTIGYIVGAW